MKRDLPLYVALAVVLVVAIGVWKARKLPKDTTGFFTLPTKPVTVDELAPLGVPLGTPSAEALVQIKAKWPDTICGQVDAQCFSKIVIQGVPAIALWNINRQGLLESIVVITDAKNRWPIFTMLVNKYGKPNDSREMENRNLYRWDRKQVTVGMDSAYPYKDATCWQEFKRSNEDQPCLYIVDNYVIFFVQLFQGERTKSDAKEF